MHRLSWIARPGCFCSASLSHATLQVRCWRLLGGRYTYRRTWLKIIAWAAAEGLVLERRTPAFAQFIDEILAIARHEALADRLLRICHMKAMTHPLITFIEQRISTNLFDRSRSMSDDQNGNAASGGHRDPALDGSGRSVALISWRRSVLGSTFTASLSADAWERLSLHAPASDERGMVRHYTLRKAKLGLGPGSLIVPWGLGSFVDLI